MIVRDVTDTKTAEEELRKLPARLLSAQDQERRRIARELHDTTAQNIGAINMNLVRLEREGVSPSAARILADCQDFVRCEPAGDPDAVLSAPSSNARRSRPPVGCALVRRRTADTKRPARRSGSATRNGAPAGRRWNEICFLSFKRRFSMSSVIRAATQPKFASSVGATQRHPSDSRRRPWNVPRPSPEQPGDWAFVGVGIPSMRERLRQNGGDLEILSNQQGTTIIGTVPLQAEKTDGSACCVQECVAVKISRSGGGRPRVVASLYLRRTGTAFSMGGRRLRSPMGSRPFKRPGI